MEMVWLPSLWSGTVIEASTELAVSWVSVTSGPCCEQDARPNTIANSGTTVRAPIIDTGRSLPWPARAWLACREPAPSQGPDQADAHGGVAARIAGVRASLYDFPGWADGQ